MKIKSKSYYRLVFLLTTVCVFYNSYVTAEETLQTNPTQTSNPFFWKVEKEGKTSYFLGTAHVLISIDELLCSKDVQHHLENSDFVFVEHNYLLERSEKFDAAGKQLMLSKDGREFQALNEASQEFLRSKGISEQLNLYGYNKVLHNLCRHGVPDVNDLILDSQIAYEADSRGIPIQELDISVGEHLLETKKQKAEAFNQLSDFQFQLEIGYLNGDIKMFSYNCPFQWSVDQLANYKSGKITANDIEKHLSNLTAEKRNEYILNLLERNTQWLVRFEKAHQTRDRVFLAGGLVHFIGPVNLIDMLRKKDYTVESVTCKN